MIGTSRLEYYFIRTCIILLRYLAPLCILYCIVIAAVYGLGALRSPLSLVIAVIAVIETLFFLLVYLPFRAYLQRPPAHPPTLSKGERQELARLCHENIPDTHEYLRKWFLNAPLEEIKRENVKEFLLWALFNRGGPPGDDNEELNGYVDDIEALLEQKIEPGRGSAKSLRLTLDRVGMLHRPLLWYLIVAFVDFLTYINLLRHGFVFYRLARSSFFTLFPFRPQALFSSTESPSKHLTYWHRPHTSNNKLPVLFLHGIGIGLFPYVDFLAALNSNIGLESGGPDDQIGVIAVELMTISARITNPALAKDEMCDEIAAIAAHHGWDKFVLVGNSYGSFISTHLIKNPQTADLIDSIVLIDPVSIMLHLPDVAYNFTRRLPRRANEYELYYFASTDILVGHALSRRFNWAESVMWKKDIEGKNVTVSLAGADQIVNTEAVGRYMASGFSSDPSSSTVLIDVSEGSLSNRQDGRGVPELDEGTYEEAPEEEWKQRIWKGEGVDILWFENLDHAQVFDKKSTRRPLVKAIRTYCAQGGSARNGVIA